ncbi:MAG: glutathione S-transferase, partial [Magnetovibrio sp.]|nr:glutathione S-transferase [Magnetovibrio sp.]
NHHAIGYAIMTLAVAIMTERRHTDAASSPEFIERNIQKIRRCLSAIPAVSDPHGHLNFGDITTACALAYLDFRFADLKWRAIRPDLNAWQATIENRPAFRQTTPAEPVS